MLKLHEGRLIISSLVLGFLFNVLFFDKVVGISLPIFVLSIFLFLIYNLKQTDQLEKNTAWYFSIPVGLLSLQFALSSNIFFAFLNCIVITLLFNGMIQLTMGREKYSFDDPRLLLKIPLIIVSPLLYIAIPYTYIYKRINFGNNHRSFVIIKKILLGVIISVPILLIIIPLLSSADMIFDEMVSLIIPSRLINLFEDIRFTNALAQLIIILLASTYAFCYVWNLLVLRKSQLDSPPKPLEIDNFNRNTKDSTFTRKKIHFDATVLITVLIIINIVYILFCYIQFQYLFRGGVNALPGTFTYAEYARQGFFQLLWVTIFNFFIMLVSFSNMDVQNFKVSQWIKRLLLLIGISTYVMIASSFYRMNLYQQNYGYTYLRIFVFTFLVLETLLLGVTMLYIIKSNFNLRKIYIVSALIFYIALNYINTDALIAKKNIDLYFKTGRIDINYLLDLSYDAVPQLTRLLDSNDPKIKREVQQYLYAIHDNLNKPRHWQEFNYAKYKAKKIVNQY